MAYISTPEVAEIRKALKAEFGKTIKFSVARRDGGLAVAVSIISANIDFSYMWPDKAACNYGYGYVQINPWAYNTHHYSLFEKIISIIKSAPANAKGGSAWFDKSDVMTDYFHTAFYFDVNIGRWDKPYVRKYKNGSAA